MVNKAIKEYTPDIHALRVTALTNNEAVKSRGAAPAPLSAQKEGRRAADPARGGLIARGGIDALPRTLFALAALMV